MGWVYEFKISWYKWHKCLDQFERVTANCYTSHMEELTVKHTLFRNFCDTLIYNCKNGDMIDVTKIKMCILYMLDAFVCSIFLK